MAAAALLDQDRQWLVGKSAGRAPRPRDGRLHAYTIAGRQWLIVAGTGAHFRCRLFRRITAGRHIGFYATVPITDEEGRAGGTLSVKDFQPCESALREGRADEIGRAGRGRTSPVSARRRRRP